MTNQPQTAFAPIDSRDAQSCCVVLGTEPRGRASITEALERIGYRTHRRVAAPTCASLTGAYAVLIDGESYGQTLPWVVERTLATTSVPILILGSQGDLVQAESPRVFVVHKEWGVEELQPLLDDIVKHLVAAP